MKSLPLEPELLALAPRVIWFEEPQEALANPVRFLTYLMTYGTAEDIATVRRHVADADFLSALDAAPAGIMDARSWAYWNAMAGRYPPPPMPQRIFPT
jgi:hypothetical protein